jgi:hypothetical protein
MWESDPNFEGGPAGAPIGYNFWGAGGDALIYYPLVCVNAHR